MALTKFRCPDNEEIPIESCLRTCRMAQRCVSLPTLMTIVAGRREWSGVPSTTQLINGIMLEWLKIHMEYSIAPRDMAFALLGTAHHIQMAKPKSGTFETEKVMLGEVTGIIDLLEPDEEGLGHYSITDYKTFGSFKVARILGLVKERVPHPTEVYKRSGAWGTAGSPKMVDVFHQDPAQVDMLEEELQLNHYRLLVEATGYHIGKMLLQITVRDGGTQVAESRGILSNIYYPIEVKRLPDQEVRDYFEDKKDKLLYHLSNGIMPQPCSDRESWDKRRCVGYCEVTKWCPQGVNERFMAAQREKV